MSEVLVSFHQRSTVSDDPIKQVVIIVRLPLNLKYLCHDMISHNVYRPHDIILYDMVRHILVLNPVHRNRNHSSSMYASELL